MSNIGRRPIEIGNAKVEIKGNEIHYSGKKATGVHELPPVLNATLDGKILAITAENRTQDAKRLWGLHRALVANKIKGAEEGFIKELQIVGLGYKGIAKGNSIQFSLGYTHKIDFELPSDVTVEIDKTGQKMVFKSPYKDLLGQVCSDIRALRRPEPYKGTGIKYATEVIRRKAGKAK